jgi:uncharacterized protein YbjT (DUF2867 family)
MLAMTNETQDLTLVLGGTGKTGSRIAQRLHDRGLPVRIGSRSGAPAFDWDDRATWAPALQGVGALYIAYYPDLAVPGAAATVGELAARATAAGVRRLVLLSGRGEPDAQAAERAVQDVAPGATIVRCSWFSQNFSEGYMREPLLEGELALPVDRVAEPFLDAEDVADVAVAALTDDGHEGRLYELTGPRLLRFDEAVAEIARATGRPLRFVPLSAAEYAAGMGEQGLPEDVVELLGYLFAEVLDGRNAHLSDGVQQALGRPPRDFRDYARQAANAGAWTGAER